MTIVPIAGKDLPEPVGSAWEFMRLEDKRYFEDHPGAEYYDRAPFPMEDCFGKMGPKTVVRVYQVIPGVRMRYWFPGGNPPDKFTPKPVKKMRKWCAKHNIKSMAQGD